MNTISKGIVQIVIYSRHDEFHKNVTCLTILVIADLVPTEIFPRKSVKIPTDIALADPDFHLPRPVDILIGSGATVSLFIAGQIDLSQEGYNLYLQKTLLGWIVVGSAPSQKRAKTETYYLTNLEDLITEFWTMEELDTKKPQSREEVDCEEHFLRNVCRGSDGRYTVRLPFHKYNKRLGESRNIAFKRLLALERKLNANATLKTEYTRIIKEYLELGHMSYIERPDDDGYYMPHHAVIKESSNTTKVRIVFDASAATSIGTSLNEMLMIGPTIQDKLFSHLVRFRTYKYVITADIEKMYRQIWVHNEDRRYQRILWRRSGKVETYQLNTLTFGVSSSPFLAIRTIQRLADDEYDAHPKGAEAIKNHLYVDDLLSGADTIDDARAIRNDVIALLACGGFTIRQWASNDARIVNDLNDDMRHANFKLDLNPSLKALGIIWHNRDDKICYKTNSFRNTNRLTKRKLLAEIARIFDPLGLLGPVVLYTKILMQSIWRSGLNWDDDVPSNIYAEWSEFVQQLKVSEQFSFDRKLFVDNCQNYQIHGFCDASNVGYGAILYIRSISEQNNAHVALVCAKSRVAPLKIVTIPRLELCGALLLTRLFREIIHIFKVEPSKVIFWCDSTIVLDWLKTSPHLLKMFVANRVAEIQELTEAVEWRYVKSGDNPADALSRGQMPHAFIRNHSWTSGPQWLIKNEDEWPVRTPQISEIPELKKDACFSTTIHNFEIFDKYSSYSKLIRIVAYCLRFLPTNKYTESLSADEINESELRILRILQMIHFSDTLKELKSDKIIKRGTIKNLSPFLDENGLIRVGGRLKMSNLSFPQKHPILLPSRHRITDNIIREAHQKYYHAGIQTTLYNIRQKFWLLDGRNQVRKVIRACKRCFRFNAIPVDYKMSNLPPNRVREAIPFFNTGIDFCGPFYVKERKYRNQKRIKVYVCIFICMTIKAVHLEVVSDLTTDGFLAALRRFIARRGMPAHIYSDNGTNLVGANNQLKEIYILFNSDNHKNYITKFTNDHKITWHFMPPLSPHFGGLWESMVKLFKHHLKRVVGDSLFTFEEFNTFVIEIEGILNSRPIVPLSSDPNDLLALSPAHYLIGKPITALPEAQLSSVPINRLSTWQHIVRQDFWARWNVEYLNELQKRSKWYKEGPRISEGTIVLIRNKNLPCTQWSLGKIIKLYPGDDGVTRAATIKTSTGEIKRNAKLLCPLPVE